jgi:putative SOS response-associated peptidase YedK
MCGRYRRITQKEELARLCHIPIPKQTDLPISYNIAPTQQVLTIRFNPATEQRSLDALQWGLIPYPTPARRIRQVIGRKTQRSLTGSIPQTTIPDTCGWILRMAQNG